MCELFNYNHYLLTETCSESYIKVVDERDDKACSCRPTYLTRALRRIRPLMTLLEAAETFTHDNVTARLDYCNSLRHGTLTGNLYKLLRSTDYPGSHAARSTVQQRR